MKRKSACGSLLLALLVCMMNAPAAVAQYSYAGGYWDGPYFSSVGNTTAAISTTTIADHNTLFTSSSWAYLPAKGIPYFLPGYYHVSLNGDQCVYTDGSGTYTITYIYKGYSTQQQTTPPLLKRKMYLKETSAVSWGASGYIGNILILGGGDANNGRKDPVVINIAQTGGTSSGVHLL